MTNKEAVDKYENLVYSVAISKRRPDLFNDLLQEGFMALCRANELYKEKRRGKKASFLTYARTAISNNMNQYIILNQKNGLDTYSLDDTDFPDKRVHTTLESESEIKYLMKFVRRLPEKYQYIIVKFYNLDGRDRLDCAEIGVKLNMSKERVRKLKMKALRKLKRLLIHYKRR